MKSKIVTVTVPHYEGDTYPFMRNAAINELRRKYVFEDLEDYDSPDRGADEWTFKFIMYYEDSWDSSED